jgi:hypothetical protein
LEKPARLNGITGIGVGATVTGAGIIIGTATIGTVGDI